MKRGKADVIMMVVVVVGDDDDMNGFYRPPKNFLTPWRNGLPLPPFLVVLVLLGGCPCDGRTIVTRSSYVAWVSRGFWPKRPKAQGAVGVAGKREKEGTLEDIVDEEDWCFLEVGKEVGLCDHPRIEVYISSQFRTRFG